MSFSTIRAAIKSRMEGVTGVENVQDFVFWCDDYAVLYDRFAKDGRINFWQLQVGSPVTTKILSGYNERSSTWNLFGIYSLKSNPDGSTHSSTDFETIIESILDEFTTTFSFLAGTEHTPASMISLANGVYAESPIHISQIQMVVTERIVKSTNTLCEET